MANNADLNKAARAKKDEFYTQLTDIEKECGIIVTFSKEKSSFATAMTLTKVISLNTLR